MMRIVGKGLPVLQADYHYDLQLSLPHIPLDCIQGVS